MSRPKCIVGEITYTRECAIRLFDCKECGELIFKGGSCPAIRCSNLWVDFTPAEKIAALLDALEELTGIKGLGANNPMESRLAIAALSDYIRNSKLKEAEQ